MKHIFKMIPLSILFLTACPLMAMVEKSWDDKDEEELIQELQSKLTTAEIKVEKQQAYSFPSNNNNVSNKSNDKLNRPQNLIFMAQDFRHNEQVDLEQTRAVFKQAIALAKEGSFAQAKAYQGLAKTYSANDPKQALELFNTAIQLIPDYPDFYFSAGDHCGFRLKNIPMALEYFNNGLKCCTGKQINKKTIYYTSIGALYRDVIGDLNKAKEYYQDGINFSTHNAPERCARFHRLMSDVCVALKQPKEACFHIQEAVRSTKTVDFDETLTVRILLAKILRKINRIKEAEKVFAQLLLYVKNSKNSPAKDRTQLPVFYDNYARFCKSIGQKEKALQIFQEGIDECKYVYSYETSQLYKHYGVLLEEEQNFDQAKCVYKEGLKHAQKRHPQYCAELASKIAVIWRKKGNKQKAEKYEIKSLFFHDQNKQSAALHKKKERIKSPRSMPENDSDACELSEQYVPYEEYFYFEDVYGYPSKQKNK